MSAALIGFIVFALIVILPIIGMYNGLIRKKNNVENSFSTIDVMLKKRHDLIPNLVASVKKYMDHESGVLGDIVKLRSQIVENDNLSSKDKMALENQLTQKLSGFNINVENYPALKANENFLNLQRNLTEIESQLSASRRAYNSSVLALNNGIETFPTSLMAGMMNLYPGDFFEAAEAETKNPDIGKMFD